MYENKISARQLRRMIFIETFGAGALSIRRIPEADPVYVRRQTAKSEVSVFRCGY